MIVELYNNSLTSKIHYHSGAKIRKDSSFSNIAVINSGISMMTAAQTSVFNSEYNKFVNELTLERNRINSSLLEKLKIDPTFDGYRNNGVSLAWKYEKADVLMGGRGSKISNWSNSDIQQIKDTGRVRGAEGHHINNVANNQNLQTEPDNIRFFKSREEHRDIGHNGDFSNESSGKLIDKNKMLKETNLKRVLKNELNGIGIATVIGLGVGFTMSFILDLAKNGISKEYLSESFFNALNYGMKTGILSGATYGVSRCASLVIKGIGIDIGSKLGQVVNMGFSGIVALAFVTIVQYVKMRKEGIDPDVAIRVVCKQSIISISILALSLTAQGIYGGYAGLIVSSAISVLYFGHNTFKLIKSKISEEKLKTYAIEQYKSIVLDDRR